MKKMKRPVDLMNSVARITTASQTTGGVTARMTAETTQTRRTAVSIWLLRFLAAQFVRLYTLLTFCTYLGGEELDSSEDPPPLTHTHLGICAPWVMFPTIASARLNSVFRAGSYYPCCFSENIVRLRLLSSLLCNLTSSYFLLFRYSSSLLGENFY